MRVFLDISPYWPKDEYGQSRTVNSIYEEIKGSNNEVGRNTLRLALDGKLDRGLFANIVKLSRLLSEWSGQEVRPSDLLKVEEDNKSNS
ncbi:MAG: hypothetical protein F6K14_08315 [Symploca sp. SIO2C1]|nr:hypothetical protein [Symploca sp. SIO2C1]